MYKSEIVAQTILIKLVSNHLDLTESHSHSQISTYLFIEENQRKTVVKWFKSTSHP